MQKEKRKYLSFTDKLSIIKLMKDGKSSRHIKNQFGVSMTTIGNIMRNEKEITSKSSDFQWKHRKTKRTCENQLLEEALYVWYCQRRSLGEQVIGPQLQEQAIVFNEKMNGPPSFKASNGWLGKFRMRHSIKDENSKQKVAEVERKFQQIIQSKIENEGYLLSNIYNADEMGLQWKKLPKKCLMTVDEDCLSRGNVDEKVTVLLCSNANGTHRLPLLIIANSTENQSIADDDSLDVIFKSQCKGLMDQDLFIDWYKNHFVPTVLQKQKVRGHFDKVLLILDIAPPHPHRDILNKIHEKFEVLYLPPNVTSKLQPMSQGPSTHLRQNFKIALLRIMLLQHTSIKDFISKVTLQDFLQIISTVWQEIRDLVLQKAWKPLLGNAVYSFFDDREDSNEVANAIKSLGINIAGVDDWILQEDSDQGWESLSDDDILFLVGNRLQVQEIATEDRDPLKIEVKEEATDYDYESAIEYVSTEEAYDCFHKGYMWLQMQEECTEADLNSLRKIIGIINQKLSSS